MEVWVSEKPHLIYETTELLYAFANGLPAASLTMSGQYCLPEEAVAEMLTTVCAGHKPDEPLIRYFFGRHRISEEPERYTCLARNLVYNAMAPCAGDMSECFGQMYELWQVQRRGGSRPSAINEYRVVYMEQSGSGFSPMAKDIARLGVGEEYSQMLLEQLSGFGESLRRLEELIEPFAQRLAPMLTPWTIRAEPLSEAWREYYSRPDAAEIWCKRVRYTEDTPLQKMSVQLRYLCPKPALGTVSSDGSVFCHTGVAVQLGKPDASTVAPWEYQAFRLLGSEARFRLLCAMLDKPMSARELAQSLDMHLGVVCRDIGNLFNARLLLTESVRGRNRYRTNRSSLDILAQHLSQIDRLCPAPSGEGLPDDDRE